MLSPEDLDRLACPDCSGAALEGRRIRSDKGEVTDGELACLQCGTAYEISGGIPWLLPAPLQGLRRDGGEACHRDWRRWRERLCGFLEWRERTWDGERSDERRRNEIAAERRRDAFVAFFGVLEGHALEVGCGNGYLSRAPGFRAGAYWGLDPVPPGDAARDFRLVAGVGERLPFRSGCFDAVIVKESLHHFQDPARFLDEARRVAAPRGRLLICQGVEPSGAGPGPIAAARLFLRRSATALRLLATGRIREIRSRTTRLLESDGVGGRAAGGEAPFLWRLTREGIESEVKRRFLMEETRMDGDCLYLRARA